MVSGPLSISASPDDPWSSQKESTFWENGLGTRTFLPGVVYCQDLLWSKTGSEASPRQDFPVGTLLRSRGAPPSRGSLTWMMHFPRGPCEHPILAPPWQSCWGGVLHSLGPLSRQGPFGRGGLPPCHRGLPEDHFPSGLREAPPTRHKVRGSDSS